MLDSFWEAIDAQLDLLREKGTSADMVCQILPATPGISSGDGFFGGSGGGTSLYEVLVGNGWHEAWAKASYFYCLEAPDGSRITYIEGDIYKGDRK